MVQVYASTGAAVSKHLNQLLEDSNRYTESRIILTPLELLEGYPAFGVDCPITPRSVLIPPTPTDWQTTAIPAWQPSNLEIENRWETGLRWVSWNLQLEACDLGLESAFCAHSYILLTYRSEVL
ncbi:predicted protein [Histoplasma mississippiense (nom. inval.)]|uniref:predicted protein n=1 Tax=Ajellomyces capsulatus (strain NAm1 / WU24) TaxID=2059318 RepID=UPI000157CEDA|nr:predicted protein [Histoplasma mississippiense (nom. inval.)]EDN04369.1 predicted protein [Histoplasma mississippiense (nom. inval.)]